MPALNSVLEVLSAKHAKEVSGIADRGIEAARKAYRTLANAPKASRYASLRKAIVGSVEGARMAARDAATTHMLEDLDEVVTSKTKPSLAIGKSPLRKDVEEYIDNAIDAAKRADDDGGTITDASSWADRVVESETFRSYDEARRVAESSLRAMGNDEAKQFGFQIAKKPSDLREVVDVDIRTSEGLIPVLGKRWDAVNDRRTCEICSGLHGSLALVGLSFDGSDPPVHPRCRCVSHLWAVGFVKGEDAMTDIEARADGEMLRYDVDIDIESRETDEEKRILYGVVGSDESIDSHHSIIKAKGWSLDRYLKNPVLLWQHKSGHGAEPQDILGKAVNAYVKTGKLLFDLQFSPAGANPKADMVWGQIQRKEVRGLSVGFRPTKYRFEKVDSSDEEVMVIEGAQLVELSVVMIPSNENTLIKQFLECGAAQQLQLKQLRGESMSVAETEVTNVAVEAATHKPVDPDRNQPPDIGQVRHSMSEQNKSTTLPAEVAAILGTTDADEAKRLIAKDRLRITQLEQMLEDAKADSVRAKADLDKYRNEAADSAVEEMVNLGLIKEESRGTAQAFARSDLAGFTEMYTEQRANMARRQTPKAHLLDAVVEPKGTEKPRTMPMAEFSRKQRDLVRELRTKNPRLDLAEAYQRAEEILTAESK